MKIKKVLLYFAAALSIINNNLFSTSIDGTSSPQYLTTNQVFHNTNDYARGFVKFKAGATILGDANAFFGIYDTFSSGLDLRETGTLSLEDNLYLDSNFTISGSGVIRGNNKTIFMSGNLTITDNAVLHINSNTIIDGQGNDLIFGKRSKLFVDTNITLTLQNMRLIQTFNNLTDSCIRLAALGSKLSLKNVELALANDFLFNQGQLFIHGDVAVTGTSAFVYKSTQQSFIARDSIFYFDLGTTFSVAPATFTDCKFDQFPTTTGNSFIVLQNQTSKLKINEASFFTTPTGLKLTRGSVDFDNRCFIKTNSALDLPRAYLEDLNLSSTTDRSPSYIAYSTDGNYLAVVNKASDSLQIFDSTTLAQIGSSTSTGVGSAPVCVSWSNSSTQLAVANSGDNTVKIFDFDGANTPSLYASRSTDTNPSSCSWSTYGNYIAVTNAGASTLQIFRAPTLSPIGSSAATSGSPLSVDWGPLSKFLAVANSGSDQLQIFSFDYVSTPSQLVSHSTGKIPASVAWSPNRLFLSVANSASNTLQTFLLDIDYSLNLIDTAKTDQVPDSTAWSFDGEYCGVTNYISNTIQLLPFSNGSGLAQVGENANTQTFTTGSFFNYNTSGEWSPDSKFIAIANTTTGTLQIFSFNGLSTPTQVGSDLNIGTTPQSISWSPDGAFFAVGNNNVSGTLKVFSFDGSSTPAQVGSDVATGSYPKSVTWSYDGSYIALINTGSDTLQVFSFDGINTPSQVGSDATTGNAPNSVAWSPDGNFLAVGSDALEVFSFDGVSTPSQVGSSVSSTASLVSWTSDGNFINAIYGNWLKVYLFDGASTPIQIADDAFIGNYLISMLTKNNRLIAEANYSSHTVQVRSINGINTPTAICNIIYTGSASYPQWIKWSPDEKFIAVVTYNTHTLQVYSLTLDGDAAPISQGVSTKNRPTSVSWDPGALDAAVTNVNSDLFQIFRIKFPSLFTQVGNDVNTNNPPNTGRDPYIGTWSPDGRFVAVNSFLDGYLKVFSFDETTTPTQVASIWTDWGGASIDWSPDGKFIAIINGEAVGSGGLRILSFDWTNTLTQIGNTINIDGTSVSWSPDGRFLAVGGGSGTVTVARFRVFSFDGVSTPKQVGTTINENTDKVSWSPDGRFIATVDYIYGGLKIYSFDGSNTPTQVGNRVSTGSRPYSVEWSPDGRYIAITCSESDILQVFSFNGSNSPAQVGYNASTTSQPWNLTWSPDGKFIAIANISGNLQVYTFDGFSTPKEIGSLTIDAYLNSLSWSPDGKYMAVVRWISKILQIYKLNYIADRSVQALTNGTVFGDSILGDTHDTSINVLAGSNIYIDGLVNYDCTI
jgi:WD40 repeat protein